VNNNKRKLETNSHAEPSSSMRRTYKRKDWKKRMMMISKMHQMVLVLLARMKRRMKKHSLNYTSF
jgi:hypothetical protein